MNSAAATEAAPSSTTPLAFADRFFPEFALMLTCCSLNWDSEIEREACNLLTRPIDWAQFLELTEKHGVLPLVQPSLMKLRHSIPADFLIELERRSAEQVRRALCLTQLLQKVMRALDEVCVPVLPYKGPILAQRLYGDVAMRQYSDLDLLVPAGGVVRAKAELAKIGLVPHTKLRAREEKALLASGYELTLDGLGNRNLIEIQWRILPAFYSIELDVGEMFSRTQSIGLAGRQVQTLCDEDLLLTLCVHAAKHSWTRFSWISDIAQLSCMPGLAWAEVMGRAKTLGIKRIVGISLFLAKEMFSIPLPSEMEGMIGHDPEVRTLGGGIIQRMSQDMDLNPESFAYFRLMLRTRERVRDRVRFVVRLIVTPTITEWSMVRLPEWLFPLYRVVRVFRLIGRLCSIRAV